MPQSSPPKGARPALSPISYLSTTGVFTRSKPLKGEIRSLSRDRISSIIKTVFDKPTVRIDAAKYRPHSLRGASISCALAAGALLEKVAAQAHLHPSTLSLYYSKPITDTASPIPVLPSSSPLTHFLRARFVAAYPAAPTVSAAVANARR